ncbi:MAG: amino acid ABC transporter permease, partial [Actinomycetia bacterium]|nr:amino acid ABC transporter permease [Actinomycetes bacterium]
MSAQSVLFDAPGPKARRRHMILTVVSAVLALAFLVFVAMQLHAKNQFNPILWSPFTRSATWTQYILPGLWGTLKAAAVSVVCAMIFGLVFGMGRLSQVKPIRWVCGVIVEFFRAVPVLLMMFFVFLYMARSMGIPGTTASFWAVVIALTLYNGSVIAELVRSGVHQLPKGQSEAGLAVGLTPAQTLRSIELPQALTAMLPALMSQLVVIVKDSALGTALPYFELMTSSRQLGSARANILQAYVVAAVIFILINWILTMAAGRLERYIATRGHTSAKVKTGASALVAGGGAPGEFGANIADAVEDEVDDLRHARHERRAARRNPPHDGQKRA